MPDLLIELFSEEIPARMQANAAEALKTRMTNGMVEAGITYASAAAFSTPRRLTLAVEGVLAQSPALREERKGPRADAPDKAIEGFLRGVGLSRDQLETRSTPKGDVLFAVVNKPGRAASDVVADVLDDTVRNFPWPKSMRWGSGPLRWVRPLHSILCVLSDEAGAEIIPVNIDGIDAGDTTSGHRFMAPESFAVSSFEDYALKLKRANVVLDAAERADHIWADASNLAFAVGLEVVEDKGLLTEVAGLVEWPVVLMGSIGKDFLDLPSEVLQTSMKEHQKFFSVRNPKSARIERFVTVANIETADDGATILAGNEKVLSARLADAKFFWDNDLRVAKTDLSVWAKNLENVTFHNRLGSQGERIRRIAALARELAPFVGADPELAKRAGELAKLDLSSEMVSEFPELQGVMGRYYIATAGEDAAVAQAAQDHYSPLGPSDDVPTAPVSVAVALADKIDILSGFWAIDEKPTGSKDPFALRRAALGLIRLILSNDLRLPLDRFVDSQLLKHKIDLNSGADQRDIEALNVILEKIADFGVFGAAYRTVTEALETDQTADGSLLLDIGTAVPDLSNNLLAFVHDRLKVYLRDAGIRHDIIDACIAMSGNDDLKLLTDRARALDDVLKTEAGENLIQGFRRANNILTQAEEKDGVEYSFGADPKFAEDDSEVALFSALKTADTAIQAALGAQDYPAAMTAMAALRAPIDSFFETVQINADNPTLRRNRLNLLHQIRDTCLRVADLSRIEG